MLNVLDAAKGFHSGPTIPLPSRCSIFAGPAGLEKTRRNEIESEGEDSRNQGRSRGRAPSAFGCAPRSNPWKAKRRNEPKICRSSKVVFLWGHNARYRSTEAEPMKTDTCERCGKEVEWSGFRSYEDFEAGMEPHRHVRFCGRSMSAFYCSNDCCNMKECLAGPQPKQTKWTQTCLNCRYVHQVDLDQGIEPIATMKDCPSCKGGPHYD